MEQLLIFQPPKSSISEHRSRSHRPTVQREAEGETGVGTASRGVETLLTSREAAEILKLHPKVLERMAKRGEVPAFKVGKFWRYRATTLDAWINSRLQSSRQPCRIETQF